MRPDRILLASVCGMALALLTMIACLAFPAPRTMAVFLGVGLPAAFASVGAFAVSVLRDLRARRIL